MRKAVFLALIVLMVSLLPEYRAHAQIETLVMPGDVIDGHADIETECKSCHVKFKRSKQRDLCMDCHEEVAADITSDSGFHGLSGNAKLKECSYCHTEHEGRNADIVGLDESTFEHELTDFPLEGKHAEVACDDCHATDDKHREAPTACFSCHEDDNVHGETMGTECADCHSSNTWIEVGFDHDATGYPLIGNHATTACLACHADQTFQSTPTGCYDCHASDDAHDGRSGTECDTCHSPTGWLDTSFDHARDTDFPLTGRHAENSCDDCHSDDPFSDELDSTCYSCHSENDNHEGHFGQVCDTCHGTDEWVKVLFDHDTDTDYDLHGAHAELECTACHMEPVFEVALQTGCNDCHAEDDPHEGTQGASCTDCHNETSWQERVFFDHDLTRFPLLGKHAETECLECHESQRFRDAPSDCVSCHADDDRHDGRFAADCGQCHTPVDWQRWRFDHDAMTDFPLVGAHEAVSCESCHRGSLDTQMQLGNRCGDCHRADDVHNGEFGFDCGRCHSADSFEEVQRIQ